MAPRKPKNPLPYAYQVGKVPIIGPWYGRIGRIHQIAALPCSITPMIAIQAGVVAAPRLAYSLLGPDCIDDAWDYLKGKPGRHRRQNFFKTMGSKSPFGGVDRGLSHFIIPLGDLAQRIGWYMALVDGISEFVVNWTSLMYQYSGCRGLDTPFANAKTEAGFGLIPFGGFSIVGSWEKLGAHIFNVGFTEMVIPHGYNPGVGFGLSSGPNPLGPPDGTWQARLFRQGGADNEDWIEPVARPGGVLSAQYYNFSAYGDSNGGTWRVAVRSQGGPVWITGGAFFGYGSHPGDARIGVKASKCDPIGKVMEALEPK